LDNQPEEFTGAVGDFRINLEVLQSDIRKNEPFTVRLSIQGSGNIPLITDPLIEWPENSQVSGPLVTEETDRYRYPLSGEKNFDYTVQATDTGAFYIPPVSFAFFEPSLGEYKTITTDSVRHEVQVSQKSIAS